MAYKITEAYKSPRADGISVLLQIGPEFVIQKVFRTLKKCMVSILFTKENSQETQKFRRNFMYIISSEKISAKGMIKDKTLRQYCYINCKANSRNF